MILMLIEPLHIRPGTPTLLRRRCMFSTDTYEVVAGFANWPMLL
jgi:hypothetical protein